MTDDTAWPLPSGAPAGPPPVETPVLPAPYGPAQPAPVVTEGEPAPIAEAHVAVRELRYADAVRLLEEFLREHPEDARAWHRLAGARIGLLHHEAALVDADRSVELDPESAAAHRMRGIALSYLKRPIEAEESARRAIELDPGLADGHALLAEVLNQQGRAGDAMAAAHAALAIDPGQMAALRVIAGGDRITRWLPLIAAAGLPAGVALVILALAMDVSSAIFGGFAAVAFLPLLVTLVRRSMRNRMPAPVRPLPRTAFPLIPVGAGAFVAVPVLIAGTRWSGALVVIVLTALLAVSFTLNLYRQVYPRR